MHQIYICRISFLCESDVRVTIGLFFLAILLLKPSSIAQTSFPMSVLYFPLRLLHLVFQPLPLLLAALVCLPSTCGATELAQRLRAIHELRVYQPESALADLRKMQPDIVGASKADRVAYDVEYCLAVLGSGKKEPALVLADQAISLAREVNDEASLASAYLAKSFVLSDLNDPTGSNALAFMAAKLALHTNDHFLQVQVLRATASILIGQGDFAGALSNLQQALTLARDNNDPGPIVGVLDALAGLYTRMKEFDKGFAAAGEAFRVGTAMDSPARMAAAKLMEYAVAIDAAQPERGRRALLSALGLARKVNAREMIAGALVNLSDSYLKAGDLDATLQYARQAADAARALRDDSDEATALINIGLAYLGQGKIALGVTNCEAGLRYYEKSDSRPELQDVLLEYGAALEHAGQYQAAVVAYHRERKLVDELSQMRREKAVVEIQEKYEAEKKQRQIESLTRDNRLKNIELDNRRLQQRFWWLLSALVAMALAVLALLIRKVRGRNRQLEQNNSALQYDNVRDPLTGLYNRRHFHDILRDYRPDAKREESAEQAVGDPVGALFVLDLDHFKSINDNYGHAAGDAVLKTISLRLQEILRETDMIFRWGGEEFLAFLPKLPQREMDEVARRILRGIASTEIAFQAQVLRVQISIGYVPFPLLISADTLSWERMLHLVDMALYLAKVQGRNRACGLTAFVDTSAAAVDSAERDLGEAWREGLVTLNFVTDD